MTTTDMHTAPAVRQTDLGRSPQMHAVTRDRYGAPDVVRFATIARPAVPPGHLLVRVAAAGVNRGDALEVRGWPRLARLLGYGALRPARAVPGTDMAGTVVALHPSPASRNGDGRASRPQEFAIGDRIVGVGTGAFAEFAILPMSMAVRLPGGADAVTAAALPTTGMTALQAVRDAGRVAAGQQVAVIGASGGVGTFAVQIAAAFGAEVTAVAGTRNVELVRSLGATHVVDYTLPGPLGDITRQACHYDVIIDTVGSMPLRALRDALAPRGALVVVGGSKPNSLTGMGRFVGAAVRSPFTRRRLVPLFSRPRRDDLETLVGMMADGTLRPVVGRVADLAATSAILRQVEAGHGTGRSVVTT